MGAYITIDFNGQTIGLRYGLSSVKRIGEKMVMARDMSVDDRNVFFVKQVLYSGYINDCYAKDELPVFRVEDFHDFVEKKALEKDMEGISAVLKVYHESINVPEMKPNGKASKSEKKNLKKKLTGIQ